MHPDSEPFLKYVHSLRKQVVLVTNAHYKTLDLKMNHVGLLGYFDHVVSSFDLGAPKEFQQFWQVLSAKIASTPAVPCWWSTTAAPSQAARDYGIKYVFFKAISSSQAEPETSRRFPVLHYFTELMP